MDDGVVLRWIRGCQEHLEVVAIVKVNPDIDRVRTGAGGIGSPRQARESV
jgi:hypothetical protein